MNEIKIDRRTRKTKEALLRALTRLMAARKLNQITVREITDLADVNRSTFYLHYTDVFDMLGKIESEMLEDFKENFEKYVLNSANYNSMLTFLNYVFEFVYANADLCRILLGPDGDVAFVNKFKDAILRSQPVFKHDLSVSEIDYFRIFIITGCIGVIQKWLADGMALPTGKMASIVFQMIFKDRPEFSGSKTE